ncbi:MAG: alpha-amylase, partial [Candidatus Competibacter sp.]
MTELNGVMMQYFHWYSPDDGSLWDEVSSRADALAQAGFTALWLPPAYKGFG